MRGLLTALLVLGFSAYGWSRGDEDVQKAAKEEGKKLEGTWQVTEAELAGMKLPEQVVKHIQLVLNGDRYVVTTAENKDQGTVHFLPDKSPKAMDIVGVEGPNKGKTFLAIYELDENTLKICYDLKGQERPTEFKTKPKTQLFLAIYHKQKP